MSTIETIVLIITAIISLPYICRVIRRPTLLYCAYLLLGFALGEFLKADTRMMLDELGRVGFILLLFMIGLEVELPPFGTLRKSFPFCFLWLGIQIPLFVLGGWLSGLGLFWGFAAGAAISACSLGIAYGIAQGQKHRIDEIASNQILIAMVVLEVFALFVLGMSEVVMKHGWSELVLYHAMGIIGFILLIRSFSHPLHRHLSKLIEDAGLWKVHQLFLVIFAVAMIGDRLGLAAQKTAFFLGLFMPGITDKGIKLEDELKPVAQGILIPIFFISLGSKIAPQYLLPYSLPIAVLITALLFGLRFFLFKWKSGINIPAKYFLLFCPNLTVVAVAAEMMMTHSAPIFSVNLFLATGFFMTIASAAMFPSASAEKDEGEEVLLELEGSGAL